MTGSMASAAPSPLSVLVVEDDAAHGRIVAEVLEREGHEVTVAASGAEGLDRLEKPGIELVVTDLRLQDRDGMELVERCRSLRGERETPQCLVVTGFGTVEGAVKAMQAGALSYLQKPVDLGVLRETVRQAADRIALERSNRALRTALDKTFAFPGIIGETPEMQRLLDVMNQVVDTNATVLILGESGTGKELVAQALHRQGPRRNRPFVPLNCAALAEGVLESELFGHERGAFTGAVARRKGRFEAADGGTLFLDEVGDMPLSTQAKLLRTLESGEVVRVGSNDPIHADVRLVAATNCDLKGAVASGAFREDLYFRLRVVTIELPPLRERRADLPALTLHFVRTAAERHGRSAKAVSKEALDLLTAYRWPGNVRELRNVVEAMVLMSREPVLPASAVPAYVREPDERVDPLKSLSGLKLNDVEKILVVNTLKDVGGNRERAARLLGVSTRTLYRKIQEYGLSVTGTPAG
jgi:two-component system, NtrC family, response regulator HydG